MTNKYDVIIIGGGIAGLSAGLHLQKMGKRSLILEHGNQAGGNMSGIWRKGFYFDCGDMSTEEVGVLFPILKSLDLYNPDEWMRAGFRWVTPDCDVMFHDYDQMREDFKKGFPNSAAGIDKWFDFVKPTCLAMKDMMQSGPFPFAVQGWEKLASMMRLMVKSLPIMGSAKAMMTKTAEEMVADMFPDEPRLRWLFAEANVKNMLLMMHLFFWYAFVQDYWYPKAGLQGFTDKLVKAYQERGGEIRFKSTVDKVINSGRTITACETSRRERFAADYFINTGNPKRLITEMLDNPGAWPHQDAQKTLQAQVSKSVTSAFLGVDMDREELRKHVKGHHTLYWRTYDSPEYDVYDPNAHNRGWSMISAPSLDLPHLAPEGKSSLVVQVFTSYRWQNGWKTGTDDPFFRNPEYRELKQKVLDDIIKKTEYIIPGLSGRIIFKELATPRSMSRWTLNPEGSIMGWTYDSIKCHLAKKHVRFRTPLKNLFQAGHYSIWPGGVVFSALSGKIVSRGIYEGFWRQLII